MEETKKEVLYIPIDSILPNRFQPRLAFNEKDLNELANSIIKYGVIQPVVLRPIGDKYEIIAGERRYKACTIAGLKKIPSIIMPADDNTSAEIALLENLQRKNLTPIEEAKAFKKLLNRGFTQEDIALKLGVSQSLIANKVRLLNLPEDVQNALLYNKISERHARGLLTLKDETMQSDMLKRIIEERLTVKQTEDEIALLLGNKKETTNETDSLMSIEEFLKPQSELENKPEVKSEEVLQEKNDILEDMEFLDLKVPEVVDISESEDQNEYSESQEVVNPFDKPAIIPDETPKIEEFSLENQVIDMPSTPFNEAGMAFSEEIKPKVEEEQKSIKEQLGEVDYELKDPTIEDLNTDQDYNKIERIETEEEKAKLTEEEASIEDELTNEFGEIDLPKVITKVRTFTSHLGSASTIIDVSEIDLPEKYQITIEIKKN